MNPAATATDLAGDEGPLALPAGDEACGLEVRVGTAERDERDEDLGGQVGPYSSAMKG
jgi:hypothetical protein